MIRRWRKPPLLLEKIMSDKEKYETEIMGKMYCEYTDCNNRRKKGSYYCDDCHMETYRTSVTPYGSKV